MSKDKKKSKKSKTTEKRKIRKRDLREAIAQVGGVNIQMYTLNGWGKGGDQGVIGFKASCQVNQSTCEGAGDDEREALSSLLNAALVLSRALGSVPADDDDGVQPGGAEGPFGGPDGCRSEPLATGGIIARRPIRDLDQA